MKKTENISLVRFLFFAFLIAWAAYGIILICESIGWLEGNIGYIVKYALIGFGGACAPAYAAYIVMKRANKVSGLAGFFKWIHSTNSILGFLIVTAVFFVIILIQNILLADQTKQAWYVSLIFLPIMLVGGGFEEVGWRGILQPALEKKMPFPVATLLVGIIWAVWHVPLFFIRSSGQFGKNFLAFTCLSVTLSFVLAALYKLTHCVFSCMLLHAWNNALGQVFTHDYYSSLPSLKTLSIFAALIVISLIVWYLADQKKNALQ